MIVLKVLHIIDKLRMEEEKEIISKIKILIAGSYGIYSPLCGEIP